MSQTKNSVARRTFLVSLLTGAGAAAAALGVVPKRAAARKDVEVTGGGAAIQPILYRRTEDVERYYRTLYT